MPNQPIQDAPQPSDLLDLFQLDSTILTEVAAQRARRSGLLKAKQEALKSAQRLAKWGRKLLVGVLVVSFIHLWEQISLIRPANVPELPLWPEVYHVSSALLTVAIDAVAFYLVATRSTSAYAGNKRQTWSVYFYYLLTFLLNGMFVLRYSPNMPAWIADVLPASQVLTAVLLALLIPTSIAAVEKAHHIADAARLALIVETETLAGQVHADQKAAAHEQEQARFQEELERDRWQLEKEQRRAEIKRLLAAPATTPALPVLEPLAAEVKRQLEAPEPVAAPVDAPMMAAKVIPFAPTDRAVIRTTTAVADQPETTDTPAPEPVDTAGAVAAATDTAPAAALPAIGVPSSAPEPSIASETFDLAALLTAVGEHDIARAQAFFNGASAPRAYMQVRAMLPAGVTLAEFTTAYDMLLKAGEGEDEPSALADADGVFRVSPTRYETYEKVLAHLADLNKPGKIASAIGKTVRTVQKVRAELETMGVIVKDADGSYRRTDVQVLPAAS